MTLAPANLQGSPDDEDKTFLYWAIRKENERRTAENVRLAALPTPGTPLPMLPNSTAAERKLGGEAFLNYHWPKTLSDYYQQARDDGARLDARMRDVRNALNLKLDAGKTMDQLLAAVNAA